MMMAEAGLSSAGAEQNKPYKFSELLLSLNALLQKHVTIADRATAKSGAHETSGADQSEAKDRPADGKSRPALRLPMASAGRIRHFHSRRCPDKSAKTSFKWLTRGQETARNNC